MLLWHYIKDELFVLTFGFILDTFGVPVILALILFALLGDTTQTFVLRVHYVLEETYGFREGASHPSLGWYQPHLAEVHEGSLLVCESDTSWKTSLLRDQASHEIDGTSKTFGYVLDFK